ncbi:MAG: hypothetical protein ACTHQE_11175 [Thermomicrobiales bacterium]
MGMPMSVLWPGFEQDPPSVPFVRVSWSHPLSQAGIGPKRFSELDRILQSFTDASFSEAISHEYLEGANLGWGSDVRQIGSNAEDVHAVLGFLSDVGWDLLVSISANSARAIVAHLAELIQKSIVQKQERAGDHEITPVVEFHPGVLVHICKERVADWTGSSPISSDWVEILEEHGGRHLSDDRTSLYRVTVRTLAHDYPFVITGSGIILQEEGGAPESEGRQPDSEWPAQDGVDRSASIAFIAILSADLRGSISDEPFMREAAELANEVQLRQTSETRIALESALPGVNAEELQARHYQVGPAAGGIIDIEHYIVSLFESRDVLPPLIANLAEASVVYQIAAPVYRRMKAWIAEKHDTRLDVAISYPPRVIELSCQEWIRQYFHPKADLESDWICLTDNFYGGYLSPGHPSEALMYLVTVRSRKNIYEFTINGTGDVEKLIRIKNGIRTKIEAGNIFAEGTHSTN